MTQEIDMPASVCSANAGGVMNSATEKSSDSCEVNEKENEIEHGPSNSAEIPGTDGHGQVLVPGEPK